MFVSKLHSDDPHARAEHAFQVFELFAEHFPVGNLLKSERGVERHGAIHIAYRHSYSIDRYLRRLRKGRCADDRKQCRDDDETIPHFRFHSE